MPINQQIPLEGKEGNANMIRFRIVPIAVLLSVFMIAPAIAGAADEVNQDEQFVDNPAAEQANPENQPATPPVVEEVQAPAPTPRAAIDWNRMEAARRDARDRAQALRQQSIVNEETQAQPAR